MISKKCDDVGLPVRGSIFWIGRIQRNFAVTVVRVFLSEAIERY